MTYLADSRSQLARASRGGRAMGDDLITTSDPVAALIVQVNRFGPSAPSSFRYVPTPFPVATGNLPAAVAVAAAWIYHRRAQDAVVQFGDPGSIALLKKATEAMKNPTGYVSANLAEVTGVVQGYANAVGLPGPTGPGLLGQGFTPTMAAGVLGIAAVAYFMFKRKR